MNIDSAFPSTYLKAADLGGRRVAVIIRDVLIETIADGEKKPVVYFENKEKGLCLNKTNAHMIVEIVGSAETEEWTGTKIVMFSTKVDFGGKRVDGIRVDYPANVRKPEPSPESEDDVVPF